MTATAIDLSEASRAYRLQHMGLTVDGQPFDLARYPYLFEMLDVRVPRKTVIKGGQIGFTSTFIFDAALSAIDEKLRGILYLFPTDNDVYDFARARWNPNVNESPAFRSFLESTDSAGLKRIGQTYIYFRAAGAIGSSTKQSLSKLKTMAVDRLYLDERDEMQSSRVDTAEKRLDGSKEAGFYPMVVSLSTPTIPGYGVDYEYQLSDGRAWHWHCQRCNGWTCLELTWPDCMAEPMDKEPYYLCSKCREELVTELGEWVAARPELSREHRGYWISQLCKRSAGDVLAAKQVADERGRLKEFFNQTLARPYAEVQDQLTKTALDDCLTEIPRSLSAEGPTCAGADPGAGDYLHFIIKQRIGDRDSQTLTWGKCSFDELAQLTRKFHIQTGIIDQMAEVHSVRDFVRAHGEWWGGRYVSVRKAGYDWDPVAKVVTMGRNEALDASHAKFLEKREKLPAPDEMYHDMLVPQLCNMARIRHEDDVTGDIKYQWVVLGGQKNDHLKHAHAYATVAEERVGLAQEVVRARTPVLASTRRRSFMAS